MGEVKRAIEVKREREREREREIGREREKKRDQERKKKRGRETCAQVTQLMFRLSKIEYNYLHRVILFSLFCKLIRTINFFFLFIAIFSIKQLLLAAFKRLLWHVLLNKIPWRSCFTQPLYFFFILPSLHFWINFVLPSFN